MRAPQRVPQPGLPARVTIYEVGARDGLRRVVEQRRRALADQLAFVLWATGDPAFQPR